MAILGWAVVRLLVTGALVAALPGPGQAAGALAIGACGAFGFAYDYTRSDAAQAEAMRQCAGPGCRVVAAMKRNCAAFAIDMRNACGSYGFAAAPRLGPAQNTALRQCYSNGGKDCVIRAFVCDARG
ncbi:MAG: DUF4189 domain-containing protein [Hyphomicrobiales bacterium]|nr:DUF4189 domain-containing protein [Hyphomicrobiales bacterium]